MVVFVGLVFVAQWASLKYLGVCVASPTAVLGGAAPILVYEGVSNRLDDYQIFGTHNSYHIKSFVAIDSSWRYTQLPVIDQLEMGMRSLEFDVHYGRGCGCWSVYHIGVLDSSTTEQCLFSALFRLVAWSAKNPSHFPIYVMLEPKYKWDFFGACDDGAIQTLQECIAAAVPRNMLIAPADVRGNYSTVAEAIAGRGLPTVDSARGKILFVLDLWDENMECAGSYAALAEADRLLFMMTGVSVFSQPAVCEIARTRTELRRKYATTKEAPVTGACDINILSVDAMKQLPKNLTMARCRVGATANCSSVSV